MDWQELDDNGFFGAVNIVVGKIEWDADTNGEDIISVVRSLETDELSEEAFEDQIEALPNLSSANWTGNKPDLDQSQLDVLNIAGLKFFVDEIRLATTFDDAVPTGVIPEPTGFLRGDTDGSGVVDISDPIFNLTFQFVGGIDELPCEDAADVDDSGVVDISDPIFNLTFQFVGGIAPPPAPGDKKCGPDPTPDDNPAGELGCESFEKCPADG